MTGITSRGEKKKRMRGGGELAARDTAYRVRWLCLALILLALNSLRMKASFFVFPLERDGIE